MPTVAKLVLSYCQSLWSLYKVSVSDTLCGNWKEFTDKYEKKFRAIHRSLGLMDTLKQHILVCHVPEYFEVTGQTLKASSEEYLETAHSQLRMMEERFRLRTKGRKRGTSIHQERLLRSSYLFNFTRLGFVPHKIVEESVDVPLPQPQPHDDHTYCVKVIVNNLSNPKKVKYFYLGIFG